MRFSEALRGFFRSFYCAGRGIAAAIKQRNFRFHICAACYVIYFAARFYSFSAERWALLLLTITSVLTAEVMNTAIEHLCDKVTTQNSHRIRLAKDCAAGAVLIAAVISVVIGVLLFWDRDIFSLISLYFTEPLRLALLLLSVVISVIFIFMPEMSSKDEE